MAGRRRDSGRPLRRVVRVEKRRAALADRLHDARTWRDRLGPAVDYVRAGIARVAITDPRAAEAVAEQLVRVLTRTGADLDAHTPRRSA
jgi:hypothetical protein